MWRAGGARAATGIAARASARWSSLLPPLYSSTNQSVSPAIATSTRGEGTDATIGSGGAWRRRCSRPAVGQDLRRRANPTPRAAPAAGTLVQTAVESTVYSDHQLWGRSAREEGALTSETPVVAHPAPSSGPRAPDPPASTAARGYTCSSRQSAVSPLAVCLSHLRPLRRVHTTPLRPS